MQIDYFTRLGFPRRFFIDERELDTRYRLLMRQCHPDFHQQSSAADLQSSLAMSSEINQAYRVLSEPWQRAEYLFTLLGGSLDSSTQNLSSEFLEEMMEIRLSIASGEPEVIQKVAGNIQKKLSDGLDKLKEKFQKLTESVTELESVKKDKSPEDSVGSDNTAKIDTNRERLMSEIQKILRSSKFLRSILKDLK